MTARELREKFINFFVEKGHKKIPSASLIPENDSSTLFISAGMHPLVPYLLGEPHPLGRRLCSIQKCLRTVDIDAVGDAYHHTFFEMMGNWSLGDYWKEEIIQASFEFLTKILNIPAEKIFITCFVGDSDAPKDEETALVWGTVGIPGERIYFLGKEDNWWGPAGETGPCGPDSEMFYDTGKQKCGSDCRPGCSCGKYIEIWNDVFMMYNKTAEGNFVPLKQRNIDTGMGVERTLAVLDGHFDDYRTELFWPIIEQLELRLKVKYNSNNEITRSLRIIADHLKASVFLISDGVRPSNKLQGYILRRLLRRSASKAFSINKDFDSKDFKSLVQIIISIYPNYFKETNSEEIAMEVSLEIRKFRSTIERGFKEIEKYTTITGKIAFDLYQTYGFPLEVTRELAEEKGQIINEDEFRSEFRKHQELSRTASSGMFKGGLQDHSEIATKYHTATHLLHQALRDVLGDQVHQVGSNITAERLRFDFTYPEKLTNEQIKKVEDLVNEKIKENLAVKMETMSLEEARKKGALAFFEQKYGEQVKVYSIDNYSMEVCGGPHVNSTGEIGKVKIIKEESCGAGKRRIYATLSLKFKVKS